MIWEPSRQLSLWRQRSSLSRLKLTKTDISWYLYICIWHVEKVTCIYPDGCALCRITINVDHFLVWSVSDDLVIQAWPEHYAAASVVWLHNRQIFREFLHGDYSIISIIDYGDCKSPHFVSSSWSWSDNYTFQLLKLLLLMVRLRLIQYASWIFQVRVPKRASVQLFFGKTLHVVIACLRSLMCFQPSISKDSTASHIWQVTSWMSLHGTATVARQDTVSFPPGKRNLVTRCAMSQG